LTAIERRLYTRHMSSIANQDRASRLSHRLYLAVLLLIFAVGIAGRLYDLGGRSIWADEAWVALKVSQESVGKVLFDTSARHYSYPPFFGVSIHLATRVLGNSEAALRLLPALASIGALFLIYFLALRLIGKFGALVGLSLFSFSYWGVIYAKELKQYSFDLVLALALLLLAERLIEVKSKDRWIAFGACAALGIWFSQTLLFIIPGALLSVLFDAWKNKDRRNVALSFATGAAVLISFLVNYAFFITKQRHAGLPEYWVEFFADTSSVGALLTWTTAAFRGLVEFFSQPHALWPAVGLIAVGVAAWAKRSPRVLLYTLLPFALAYFASVLGLYPFGGSRTNLFLMPLLFLFAAQGVQSIVELTKSQFRALPIGVFALLIVLWSIPGVNAALVHPFRLEESRPVVRYIEQKQAPGDRLYVYAFGRDVFDYYYQGDKADVIYGEASRDDPAGYHAQIDKLIESGGPTWYFFTHFRAGNLNEMKIFFDYLTARCKIVDGIQKQDAAAMLFVCPGAGFQQ
jgi:4-amino-4-deoxy-L-arabinose transferase-like glycosyltransferase